MTIDYSNLRLGKRPRRHDPRTLRLARYMTSALPAAPASVDYTRGVKDWGMMLNDQLGDCIIADGPGHATQVWTLNATGTMVTPPDSLILETYEKWCGYSPADPTTDQGGIELDVLNDWRREGFNGHLLDAYVAVDLPHSGEVTNRVIGRSDDRVNSGKSGLSHQRILGSTDALQLSGELSGADHPISRSPDLPMPQVATAIWLFGGAYIGVELPLSAQNQDVWDVPANPGPGDEPGSWGGHAIYLVGYDLPVAQPLLAVSGTGMPWRAATPAQAGVPVPPTLTCITWGRLKRMTWAWFEKYCSEAYALVSKDWMNVSGISPSGFDLATLESDLKLVTA